MGLVPADVDRLLGGGAVVGEAVGLDHQTELGPVEVDSVAVHPGLGAGLGQPGSPGNGQEAALELRLRLAEGLVVEQLPQTAEAWATELFVDRGAEAVGWHETEAVRLINRVFDRFRWEDGGEVDQDRDRVTDGNPGDEAAPKLSPAVHFDSGTLAAGGPRYGDVDQAAALGPDPPMVSAAAMAELGLGTAGENRCHQAAKRAGLRPTDRVDAPVQFMEPAGPEAVHHRFIGHPETQQLDARDDAVLPLREGPGVSRPWLNRSAGHSPVKRSREEDRPAAVRWAACGPDFEGAACQTPPRWAPLRYRTRPSRASATSCGRCSIRS